MNRLNIVILLINQKTVKQIERIKRSRSVDISVSHSQSLE